MKKENTKRTALIMTWVSLGLLILATIPLTGMAIEKMLEGNSLGMALSIGGLIFIIAGTVVWAMLLVKVIDVFSGLFD
jgi:hypothetical protein